MTRPFLIAPLLGAGLVLTAANNPAATTPPASRTSPPMTPGQSPPAAKSPTPPATTAIPSSPPMARSPVRRHRPSIAERRVSAANRAATQEPAPQGYINATQVYPFAEGIIYRIYTAPGRVTDIALQPGEVLGSVAAGDTVRWVIGDTSSGSGDGKQTHVLVKPFGAGLSTNVLVATDRRSYHLSLISTAATAMAAISWTYPQDALLAIKRRQEEAETVAPVAQGLSVEQLSFGYTISGDTPAWRPLRAFDDGRQTFIEFPASIAVGEAPPLFVLGAKGAAELINYRVRGRFYIVDRLFDAAELRLGTKHQQIVRIDRATANDKRRRAS